MNVKRKKQIQNQEIAILDMKNFQEEQKKLAKYVREKPLSRPKTNIAILLFWILGYLFISFLGANAVITLSRITTFKWLIYVLSYLIFGFAFLKKVCIKAIECYQRYAKEETRRKCVCIPSCSEYSIAVLKKYNVFKALNKIHTRLFKTCGGYGYMRDEP